MKTRTHTAKTQTHIKAITNGNITDTTNNKLQPRINTIIGENNITNGTAPRILEITPPIPAVVKHHQFGESSNDS